MADHTHSRAEKRSRKANKNVKALKSQLKKAEGMPAYHSVRERLILGSNIVKAQQNAKRSRGVSKVSKEIRERAEDLRRGFKFKP